MCMLSRRRAWMRSSADAGSFAVGNGPKENKSPPTALHPREHSPLFSKPDQTKPAMARRKLLTYASYILNVMQTANRLRNKALLAIRGIVSAGYNSGSMQLKRCYRTYKSAQGCKICGVTDWRMHLPMGHVGRFCDRCCPVCAQESGTQLQGMRSVSARSAFDPRAKKRRVH